VGLDVPQHELDRWAEAGLIRREDARPVPKSQPQPKGKLTVSTINLPAKPAPPCVLVSVSLALPVTVVSEMNRRDHWAVRKKRFDKQADVLVKAITALAWYSEAEGYVWPFGFPLIVTFTRLHNRGQAMDDDNLRSAFKAIRDAIAEWAGLPDNDPGFEWRYEDREGKPGVVVTITGRTE
jgi:hypothetical protein